MEGSYWDWFLVLPWLIGFQESMTELNAAHHLSMESNFENKHHIYLKSSTALRMRIAYWADCFINCYWIYQTFSVVCTVHFLSCLSAFLIFHILRSCKYFLDFKIFVVWSYSPLTVTQLLFYSSLGAIRKVHSYENAWDASSCE